MNKAELISKVSETTGLTKKDVGAFVEAFTEVVTEVLATGEEVNITGFGKFLTRTRAARKGRNPQDGSEIQIPESTTPAFKAGKQLKDAVNK